MKYELRWVLAVMDARRDALLAVILRASGATPQTRRQSPTRRGVGIRPQHGVAPPCLGITQAASVRLVPQPNALAALAFHYVRRSYRNQECSQRAMNDDRRISSALASLETVINEGTA